MMLSSMSLFVSIVWFCQLAASSSIIHTVSSEATTHKLTKRARLVLQSYPRFQISDGNAGDCANRAERVFLRPYGLRQADLVAPTPIRFRVPIDLTDLQVCNQMAKLAVDAEASFNQAITSAGGAKTFLGQELQNGKVCNKVLKQTGQVLCLQMQVTLNRDATAQLKLTQQIPKLQADISLDNASRGQRQRSFLNTRTF